MKCSACPRPGVCRLRAVQNFGVTGGFLLETAWLCDSCAILSDDVCL